MAGLIMKKLILISTITLLFSFLTLIPGCGCGEQKVKEEEKPVNVLDPGFKGPDSLPFSQGPSAPPPGN